MYSNKLPEAFVLFWLDAGEVIMLKIMLVDDSENLRSAIKEILASHFPTIEILEARNGLDAISLMKLKAPDLVFMDIRLPGANGLELTKQIKSLQGNVMVAMLSNNDYPEYRQAAKESGASCFMNKTVVSSDDLIAFVDHVIENRVLAQPV